MSEERLLSSLNESESVKETEKNFDDARIEKIKKGFNELRDKTKEIEKKFLRLEKNISKLNIMIMMTLNTEE